MKDLKILEMYKGVVKRGEDSKWGDFHCYTVHCNDCPISDKCKLAKDSDLIGKEIVQMAEEYVKKYNDDIKEEVKTSDKTEKTFREVITDIKEGDVWESEYRIIEKITGHIKISKPNGESFGEFSIYFNDRNLYTLKRKEYTFIEAFESYEQGKEIESCDKRYKKVDGKDCYWYEDEKFWDDRFCGFSLSDIRGKWYINN